MSFGMPTMRSTKDYSQKNKRIRERMEKAAAVVIGAGAGFPLPPDSSTAGDAFRNISAISSRNTISAICMRAASIPLTNRKNIGHTGADTSTSTAI